MHKIFFYSRIEVKWLKTRVLANGIQDKFPIIENGDELTKNLESKFIKISNNYKG